MKESTKFVTKIVKSGLGLAADFGASFIITQAINNGIDLEAVGKLYKFCARLGNYGLSAAAGAVANKAFCEKWDEAEAAINVVTNAFTKDDEDDEDEDDDEDPNIHPIVSE